MIPERPIREIVEAAGARWEDTISILISAPGRVTITTIVRDDDGHVLLAENGVATTIRTLPMGDGS